MTDPCIKAEAMFYKILEEKLGPDAVEAYKVGTIAEKVALTDKAFAKIDTATRQAKMMSVFWDRWKSYMEKAPKQRQAFMDVMSGQGARRAGVKSLENHIFAVRLRYFSKMADMAEDYRVRALGFSHSSKAQENLVLELYKPGSSGDRDAAQYADILSKVFEEIREHFNKAGGDIEKLPGYHLPQYHDSVKIARAAGRKATPEQAFKEWLSFVDPLIERREGLAGLSEKQYIKVMEAIFNHLRTEGVQRVPPGRYNPFKKGRVSNRHMQHRLLHFKDAASWLAYQKRFGANSIFDSIVGHIELMSKEIAAMEMFGPNPDLVVKRLRIMAQQKTGRSSTGSWVENTYNDLMGRVHSSNTRVSDVMSALRNVVTGLKIGKASIAAMSDLNFFAMTAKLNGMPLMRGFSKILQNMTVNNKENRKLATRLVGHIAYALDRARSARRISEVYGAGASARFADFMVRASGLNYWTNTMEQTFMVEMLANLADFKTTSFDRLPKNIRNALSGYGIDAKDWAVVQKSKSLFREGVEYVDPMAFGDNDVTSKITGMVREETDYAVPKPYAKVRAALHAGIPRGTLHGEIVALMGQFKSFPVSVALSHFHRAAALQGYDRLGYAAQLIIGSTLLGTVAYQAKQIVAGKTPIQPKDEKGVAELMVKGLLQGGGTAILGDVMFMDHSRLGGITEYLMGPTVQEAELLSRLWLGGIQHTLDMASETEANVGYAVAKTIQEAIPNLLWTKLAMDRAIADQVAKNLDPKWHTRQRSMRKRMRERGQVQWWKSGRLTPGM